MPDPSLQGGHATYPPTWASSPRPPWPATTAPTPWSCSQAPASPRPRCGGCTGRWPAWGPSSTSAPASSTSSRSAPACVPPGASTSCTSANRCSTAPAGSSRTSSRGPRAAGARRPASAAPRRPRRRDPPRDPRTRRVPAGAHRPGRVPFTMLKLRSMGIDAEAVRETLSGANEKDGTLFKIARTRASPRWDGSCAGTPSTSCPSCGTSSVATCRSSVRARRCPARSHATTSIPVAAWWSSPA